MIEILKEWGNYIKPQKRRYDTLKSIVAIGDRLIFLSHEMGLHGASEQGFIRGITKLAI